MTKPSFLIWAFIFVPVVAACSGSGGAGGSFTPKPGDVSVTGPVSGPASGAAPAPASSSSVAAPIPTPSGTTGPSGPLGNMPSPTPAPPVGVVSPTMTPIPAGAPADTAFTISAPNQPVPERTPGPLCIAGGQYAFVLGDDFTQETQAQFARYTTSWEINQYEYNGAQTNWVWSDQYSGIGRRNDFGAGDTYMVHVDDANPSRSYPGSWVNSIQPRPGSQIVGTPPNAYLDIRAVAVPSQYVNDASLNGAHWLTGGLQSSKFTFGYTEATVQMPANDGAWPSVWQLQVPGGGGYDGTGTSPSNYWEIDTFEKFGNTLGIDGIQQTTDSGRSTAQYSRPQTPGSTTSFHTYGQLWVPPLLGKPAYVVFYVDRKPTSYYLAPTGVGNMNMNLNLQMGTPGSFVGTPDKSQVADLKVKNYFTWQPTGNPCDGSAVANTVPTPAPSAPPVAPPPVASNIVPHLQPVTSPVVIENTTQTATLAAAPPAGALVIIQGVSGFGGCPSGFVTTNFADAYLCTGFVGQNGIASAKKYVIGGAGFDRSAAVYITGASGYTINPDIGTQWHSESPITFTKTQAVPGANELALAFGYNLSDSPRYATSVAYASNLPFNTIYQSNGTPAYGRGIAMLETSADPSTANGSTISYTGTYAWAGTPASNNNDLLPAIFTVLVR